MNDFDRYLETQLRSMLDPVVATQPPARTARPKALETVLSVDAPELARSAVEVVPVTVAAAPLSPR